MNKGYISIGKKMGYPRYYACYHYEPAIIKKGRIVRAASSYIGPGNKCTGCGIRLNSIQVSNLKKFIERLNKQDPTEKSMAKLWRNIPISEMEVLGPFIKRETEAYLDGSSIPLKNHIVKAIGKKKMVDINKGDVQKLYNDMAEYSVSVAKQVKAILNISFDFAVEKKVIPVNPANHL